MVTCITRITRKPHMSIIIHWGINGFAHRALGCWTVNSSKLIMKKKNNDNITWNEGTEELKIKWMTDNCPNKFQMKWKFTWLKSAWTVNFTSSLSLGSSHTKGMLHIFDLSSAFLAVKSRKKRRMITLSSLTIINIYILYTATKSNAHKYSMFIKPL